LRKIRKEKKYISLSLAAVATDNLYDVPLLCNAVLEGQSEVVGLMNRTVIVGKYLF
jgi:hypothetical protein